MQQSPGISARGGKPALRDAEFLGDGPQLPLDDAHVARTHAEQLLLCGREALEGRIAKRVGSPSLSQLDEAQVNQGVRECWPNDASGFG